MEKFGNKINDYGSIYTLGHIAVGSIFDGEVEITEKIDGCVSSDTPILCADLIYRPAKELVSGDEIIGFEKFGVGTSTRWKLVSGTVTQNVPIIKECAVVQTTTRTIIASLDHPWFVRKNSHAPTVNQSSWIETAYLKPGHPIVAMPVWKPELSWESGYLAGQFDGEGTLVRNGKSGRHLRYYQKTGPEFDLVERLLKDRYFQIGIHRRQRKPTYKEASQIQINGDWTEIIRFLGTYRPQRLLSDSRKIWEGASVNFIPSEYVISVTPIGPQIVSGLSTSCETYIANGLLSHNSQVSFGMINGDLCIRSKNQQIFLDANNGMFNLAVEKIREQSHLFTPNWIYRGEFLLKPKHNTLFYSRTPKNNVAIYDIERGPHTSDFLRFRDRLKEVLRIGFEPVPLLFAGPQASFEDVKRYLETDSILGGVKIEGVVVKNYEKFSEDKKVMKAKYVSAEFQEKHVKEWKTSNPTRKDVVETLIESYRVPARWAKAVQHLRDDGKLEGSPRDIGNLIKEAQEDLKKEEAEAIKEVLYKHFLPQILRGSVSGLPEWWKEEIAEGNIEL